MANHSKQQRNFNRFATQDATRNDNQTAAQRQKDLQRMVAMVNKAKAKASKSRPQQFT
jgi:hypothetical protein